MANDPFEAWRKALEEGTQAWLRGIGQAGAPPAPPPPLLDFAQLWRPVLTQGLEMWQKAVGQGAAGPDFMQQWKTLLDQSIEAWSRALAQAMATEDFAQALGRYLDQWLTTQAPIRKGIEQSTEATLKTLGLPSRAQVVGLASQVVGLEEQIERLEDRIEELKALLKGRPGAGGGRETRGRRGAPARTPGAARAKEGT